MPPHPADGPRLNTLYVTHSTRKRKRRTSSRRRRRFALVSLAVLAGVAVVSVAFREPLGKRLNRVLHKKARATLVRDVTAPPDVSAPAQPVVRQANTPTTTQVQKANAAH